MLPATTITTAEPIAPHISSSPRSSLVPDLAVDEATHLGVYCFTYRFFISLFLLPLWEQLDDHGYCLGKILTLPFFGLAAVISAIEGVAQSFFEIIASLHPLLRTGTLPPDFFTGPRACFCVVLKCLHS